MINPSCNRRVLASWLFCGAMMSISAGAQSPPASPPQAQAPDATSTPPVSGGVVHGTVKAGNVPLPGVSVVATNTLTGKRYATVTDVNGNYSMTIPANGRYVLKTELAAFAPETKVALLKPTTTAPVNQQADFALTLASRVPPETATENAAAGPGPGAPATAGRPATTVRRNAGAGAQNLALLTALAGAADAGNATGATGATLPSLAGSADFSTDSVAVTGQSGTTNPFAGVDMDQLRQNAELDQSLSGTGGPGQGGPGGGGPGGGGPGGGGFGGGGGGFGGGGGGGRGGGGRGGGGGGGGGRGGGGGGFGNFRNFKPNQPHGAFFWTGGNSALNATPFPIKEQKEPQPSYAQNQFGLTFFGAPYIPHLIEHDTKDVIFFNGSGQRSSSPFSQYGSVPTLAERQGDLSGLTTQEGAPITIFDPLTGAPFANNVIPSNRIASQATALTGYIPLPNLPGQFQNYQRLASSESNTTRIGVRFIHSFGSSSGGSPIGGLIRQYLGQGGNTLRQSVNVNFNYSHQAADELSLFPDLGGKQQTHQYSVALGYSLGKGRLTNTLGLNWNRSQTQLKNNFTGTTDIASQVGITGLPEDPQLYGLPNVTLNQFTSINEQQPNFQTNQTIAASESTSWIHKKHNIRFGGDFRRVHNDLFGNTGNVTGTFTFTGLYTEQPGSSSTGVGSLSGSSTSGSSLADLLLGLPQQSSLQAPYQKSYLRQNSWDAFGQDSWRPLSNLTLLFGLRYEYFSPYSEKYDRLSTLDTGNNFSSVATVVAGGVGPYSGKYPRDLVYPERNNFSPRIGFAVRAMKDTVVRGGYGINYAVGQYAKFIQDFAFQPPFADVQTNETTTGANITLANGFPAPQTEGNYAVNKNYRLPYVQVWNLNLQRTIPLGIVLNIGYNGSKGTRLDIVDAPGRSANASLSGVLYDYEDSVAFSNYNALTVSVRKRLQRGIGMGATYTYGHSIDNASSIGGNGGSATAVAQNWQNLLAEESNSSFDIRHQVTGNFLYELPFGPDAHWVTTGWLAHSLNGISMSGTFTFGTGEPLTPHYEATVDEVARGTTASLRPDRVPGVSLAANGSLDNWFNKAAFAAPANTYGTASRFSIPGPGTVSLNASLSKTIRFSETRTFEMRGTASNVLNTVQYSGVDTTLGSGTYGEITSAAGMRQFTFNARYRF